MEESHKKKMKNIFAGDTITISLKEYITNDKNNSNNDVIENFVKFIIGNLNPEDLGSF